VDSPQSSGPGSSSVAEIYFPALVGGVLNTAPARTLSDPAGPYLWRDALNMQVRDGITVGRPGFNAFGFLSGTQPPTPPIIGGVVYGEAVRWINISTHTVAGGTENQFGAVVTDRAIYVYPNSTVGWLNVTPTYAVGTITATNGSANISGAGGMLWQSRHIRVGAQIQIGAEGTYFVLSVTGETTATITPAFGGATAAGKAYTITRNFPSAEVFGTAVITYPLFAVLYNENLYVAGTQADGQYAAVIEVQNVYSATPTTRYLTASQDLTGTLDYLSTLASINGLAVLQDGRVVFAGNTNEVFYSSDLDTAVWTVAPAGSTPLADTSNQVHAQGRIGSTLTFHYAGGIVLADPTGLADPPLRFQASSATEGCVAPCTLKPFMGGEAFLAADSDVKVFDGNTTRSLGGTELRSRLMALSASIGNQVTLANRYHAWVYPGRDEYTLLFMRGISSVTSTMLWTYQPDNESWWPGQVAEMVGAMCTVDGPNASPIQGAAGGHHGGGTGLRNFTENTDDAVSVATYRLDTDELDHGLPLVFKTPHRVVLWSTLANGGTIDVKATVDSDVTLAGGVTVTSNAGIYIPIKYDFLPSQAGAVAAACAHRYRVSGASLRLGITAMLVRVAVGGDYERVL
jgi:hypothetical protein